MSCRNHQQPKLALPPVGPVMALVRAAARQPIQK
jgi:hypothetical protein